MAGAVGTAAVAAATADCARCKNQTNKNDDAKTKIKIDDKNARIRDSAVERTVDCASECVQ